jgi:GT2 family glycosyltransferase
MWGDRVSGSHCNLIELDSAQADVAPSVEYNAFIEQALVNSFDRVLRRPWKKGTVPRSYLFHVVAEAERRFGIDRQTVWRDLMAATEARRESFLWKCSIAPGVSYAIGKSLFTFFFWVIFARLFGARYVRQLPGYGCNRLVDCNLPPKELVPQPQASIVILSYNRLPYLLTTVAALFKNTEPDRFELIIVDNGSTDGSAEFLRELAARRHVDKVILRSRNHGISPGFNIGFAYANPKSRFLVKLDSDIVILDHNWLPRFGRFLDTQPDAGVVAMTQINHASLRWAPKIKVGGEVVSSWDWAVCAGGCMTIPRPVFDRVGFFNEDFDFSYMPDDIDYAIRLSALGYHAYYLQQCRSYHRSDLDHQQYRRYWWDNRRVTIKKSRAAQRHAFGLYATGQKPLRLRYSQYENCRFPDGRRLIEID